MNFRNSIVYKSFVTILIWLNIEPSKFKEFLKFCIVGASGVFVNMGIFWLLTRIGHLMIQIASPIAIELSILSNFLLNNAWTFRRRDTHVPFFSRMIRYHLVTGLAGLVNYLVLLLLVKLTGMNDLIANLLGILVGTFINFFLNSLWTWRIKQKI